MTADAAHWMLDDQPNGSIECTAKDGVFVVAVTEEKAMDSYNQDFTCSHFLDLAEARSLRDWLSAAISIAEGKAP